MAFVLKRGEIYLVNLSPAVGSELRDLHPCVIIQSDLLEHELRPRTIVIPFTSRAPKQPLPYVIAVDAATSGLKKGSYVLCDQITRIDKSRLVRNTGKVLPTETLSKIEAALRLTLDL